MHQSDCKHYNYLIVQFKKKTRMYIDVNTPRPSFEDQKSGSYGRWIDNRQTMMSCVKDLYKLKIWWNYSTVSSTVYWWNVMLSVMHSSSLTSSILLWSPEVIFWDFLRLSDTRRKPRLKIYLGYRNPVKPVQNKIVFCNIKRQFRNHNTLNQCMFWIFKDSILHF